MNITVKVVLCNLFGVLAIILGFYLLLRGYKFSTIIVGIIGLVVVLRGMKIRLQKIKPVKIIPTRKKKK